VLDVLHRLWRDRVTIASSPEKSAWVLSVLDPVKVGDLSEPVARACDAVRYVES